MNVSDLITLIGILLAILALISEKNRDFVFLKFSNRQFRLLFVTFLFINYLISYSWWKDRIPCLSFFEIKVFPPPSAWAYIISIISLFWAAWKVFRGKFPSSNREKLLKYYNRLILGNNIALLAEIVERYHLENIIEYLRGGKEIKTTADEFAQDVYNKIILNDTFIDGVANINPYLFAAIIKELNSVRLKDDTFVNRYLKVLTQNKNGNFFREIRNNQNYGAFKGYLVEESRPILYSLFNDIKVAGVNQAWSGICEQAVLEISIEAKSEYSALRESEIEQEEDTLWSYRITNAIWYMDIMVRTAIIQDYDYHMWMGYYRYFLEGLLNNMETIPDQNGKTRNYGLIQDIFTKMKDWKSVAIESGKLRLIESIYRNLGECIFSLAISNKLNETDKIYLLNWVWEDLIETLCIRENMQDAINQVLYRGFAMFKKPSSIFNPERGDERSMIYLNILEQLWRNRDRPRLNEWPTRMDTFKAEVIDHLLPELGEAE